MAEGFRIAEGYVEVSTRLSKAQIRAAAQEAAAEFDAASTGHYTTAGEHAGREFTTGARTSLGRDLEAAMGEAGDKTGTRFVMHVEETLRRERDRVAHIGENLGHDLLGGITGGTSGGGGLGGITGLISSIGTKFTSTFRDAQQIGRDAFADIKQDVSQVSDAFSGLGKVAGVTWGIIKFVGGPGAALEMLPPLLYAIAGGLASIPALATGAGLALASLELGTQGIGAAIGQVLNPTGGGGGGAANRVDQVASAERNLASAERNEREAQQALTEARIQATFHLQDLNLQMERQQENERGAALAIMEAQQALMQAQATGDPLAIMRAQLGLQEAVTGLKEQKQQTVELAQTKSEADAKGVEGSDQVVAALDRVTNASNAVIDGQNAVKQASVSAAAGAVSAYSKLSPEAKKFVDEIARLKPQLVGLQQYVQDRMFVGLDKKLGVWATVWIPALRHDLGELAGDANTFSKRLGDDLSKPEIVGAVKGVADAMDRVFNRFTTGGTLDKLVTAMGDLVTKATPFIEGLANAAIDKLGNWAGSLDKMAKDGRLESFFKEASKDLHDIWNIGSDVADIIGKILAAAFGEDTSRHKGQNGLDRLKSTLDDFDKWAGTEDGKKTIKEVADAFLLIADAVGTVIVWVGKFIAAFQEGKRKNHQWVTEMGADWDNFKTTLSIGFKTVELVLLQTFDDIITGADKAFGWVPGIGPKLHAAKKDIDNWVAGVNTSLDNLKPHTIDIQLRTDLLNQINAPGSFGHTQRWGGVRWADQGLVSLGRGSAGIYNPGPLYGFAEPDTGGELFMPRNGERRRNEALATVAAQWAGMVAVPARSPIAAGMGMTGNASGGPRVLQPVAVHVGGEHLIDMVLGIVADHPVVVSATAAEGDRRRRFTNSARD